VTTSTATGHRLGRPGADLPDPAAIWVRGLAKRFGDVRAVDGVDIDVLSGELFGLLGPNGAGKTTILHLLTGLARPDGGTILIGGIDCSARPGAARRLLGVVPDESNLYPELTGFQNLSFSASLYGMRRKRREVRARELLETFGLAGAGDRKFGGYSKGMKRRLTIAAGMIHEPRILFLDEPTTGIDVASARQIRRLITDLRDAGTTIVLTTHYIEEAQRLCDRVAFIVAGRIVRTDGVARLLHQAGGVHAMEVALSGGAARLGPALVEAFPELRARALADGLLRVEASSPPRVGPLVRFLEDRGAQVTEARRVQPSLEEVFVEVTGIESEALRQEKEKAGGGA